MAPFKKGDEVYYIAGDKYRDELVIASVQRGRIDRIFAENYYLIGRQTYYKSHVFDSEEAAEAGLVVVMERKIENLREKIREFEAYIGAGEGSGATVRKLTLSSHVLDTHVYQKVV